MSTKRSLSAMKAWAKRRSAGTDKIKIRACVAIDWQARCEKAERELAKTKQLVEAWLHLSVCSLTFCDACVDARKILE